MKRWNPRVTAPLAVAVGVLLMSTAVALPLPLGVQGVDRAPWHLWWTEVVAGRGAIFSPTSLNIGKDDSLQIAFHVHPANAPVALHYVSRSALGWDAEIVSPRASRSAALLDSTGIPHLAYSGGESGTLSLHYATKPDGEWIREHILAGSYFYVAIALDSTDRPHILAHRLDDMEYAVRKDDGWHIESLGVTGYSAGSGFAIGSDDRVHLTSIYPGATAFRYWTKESHGSWQVEIVSGCGAGTALALDAQNRPHVVCHDPARGVIYAWKDGSIWHQEVAADRSMFPPPPFNSHPKSYLGLSPSIALDSQGRPHISFRVLYDLSNPDNPFYPGRLHYATKVGAEWVVEVVEKEGQDTGDFSSIQIDAADRPHISYLYAWRWASPGALAPLNTGWEIRYATPLVGRALDLAER